MNFKLDEECSPVGVHGQNQLFHLRLLDIRMASLSVACIILSSQFHFNVRIAVVVEQTLVQWSC